MEVSLCARVDLLECYRKELGVAVPPPHLLSPAVVDISTYYVGNKISMSFLGLYPLVSGEKQESMFNYVSTSIIAIARIFVKSSFFKM